MVESVVVAGAGGHAREIASYFHSAGVAVLGFVDDGLDPGEYSFGRVHGPISTAGHLCETFAVGIGKPKDRLRVHQKLVKLGLHAAKVLHPSSDIGLRCEVGDGAVVGPNSTLSVDVLVGKQAHIHSSVVCAHDVVVGDFATLSPGVSVAGNVTVGDGAWLGIGCTVIQGVRIGKGALIGAGAVVIEDVPPEVVVAGVPARKL